eukprot:7259732-Alexandrium_andersonii.AAC.1
MAGTGGCFPPTDTRCLCHGTLAKVCPRSEADSDRVNRDSQKCNAARHNCDVYACAQQMQVHRRKLGRIALRAGSSPEGREAQG